MDDDAHWDALIGEVYRSTTDEAAREALPPAIARLTGGLHAAFWEVDPGSGQPTSTLIGTLPAEVDAPYQAHYHRSDPWLNGFDRDRVNVAHRGSDVVSDTVLARSEFYNDFARRFGIFHMIGTCLSLGEGPDAGFGVLSVFRPREREAFTEAEAARFGRLLPHMRQAWQIRRRLAGDGVPAGWESGAAAVLGGLGAAAAVVDGHGRVILVNAAAEGLDRAGGLHLRGAPPDRALCLDGREETRRLRRAIGEAARGGVGMEGLMALGPSGMCRVTVSPLPGPPGQGLARGAGLALLIVAPQAPATDEAALRRAQALFGLTRTEAEVTLALADERSPAEIAAMRGVRLSTIRTQLLHAMDKAEAGDLRALAIRMTRLRG